MLEASVAAELLQKGLLAALKVPLTLLPSYHPCRRAC